MREGGMGGRMRMRMVMRMVEDEKEEEEEEEGEEELQGSCWSTEHEVPTTRDPEWDALLGDAEDSWGSLFICHA